LEICVALPIEASILDVYWLSPTRDSWASGDRRFTCMAVNLDTPLRGSIENSEQ